MPIVLPAGFNVTSTEPVDARFTLANAAARLALSVANVYEGLIVYQRDNDTIYVLVNATQPSQEASWQIVGANVSGSLLVTGSITSLGGFTGSLFGTASWAINAQTASFAPAYVLNSSTSSMLAPYVLTSQTSSMTVLSASFSVSSSRTVTSSVALTNLITASVSSNTITFTKGDGSTFPITVNTGSGGGTGAGFPFSGSAVITGSLTVTGSVTATQGFTGSLFGTSSWSINALTSSTATSASYAVTASVAQSGTGSFTGSFFGAITGSLFGTSSWAINSLTASFAPFYLLVSTTSSMLAPYVLSSQTSSMTVLSASFATSSSRSITSSFALNDLITASVNLNTITFTKGDGTTFPITVNTGSIPPVFPFTGSAIVSGSLRVTGSFSVNGGIGQEFIVTPTGIDIGNLIIDVHTVTGSLRVSGSVSASLFGTASWATNSVTASFLLGSVATASLAFTASNTPNAVITASVSLNTITFTKGDGTTFPITVNTGSGGGGGGGGGTTNNPILFNASGSGSAPGTSFNGSVAITASYNTVGANKVITAGPTAPTGGLDGDYYFQYDVSNTLFFYTTRKTGSYTIAGADIGRLIEMDSGSANTLTIPTNASTAIPLYSRFTVTQYGAGQTSFASGSGVTVRSRSNFTKISARYGFANLVKIGTDEWYLYGDISS